MSLNEKQKEELRNEWEVFCHTPQFLENQPQQVAKAIADYWLSILDTHTTKAVEEKVGEIRREIDGMNEVYTKAGVNDFGGYKKGDVKPPSESCCNEMISDILILPSLINNKQGNE